MHYWLRIKTVMAMMIAAGLLFDGNLDLQPLKGLFSSSAEARIGRPATPGSVAGVARRTTRRVVRRSAIYVAALPRGCASVSMGGAVLWQCGPTYYQASGGRYVVVYID